MMTVNLKSMFVEPLSVSGDFLFHGLDHLHPALAMPTNGNLLKKSSVLMSMFSL